MANVNTPILSLPPVIGIDGSEVVALVQGGTTKRATIAQIVTPEDFELGYAPVFNVLNYGAIADYDIDTGTGTDNSTAFQDTINAAIAAGGGCVFIPNGNYKLLTGLTINLSTLSSLYGGRIIIQGAGSGVTLLAAPIPAGDALFDIQGAPYSSGGGASLNMIIQGLYLRGIDPSPSANRTGVLMDSCIGFDFNDLHIYEFYYGAKLTNSIAGNFSSVSFAFNNYGLYTYYPVGGDSPPNLLAFFGCRWVGNRQYGYWNDYGCNVSLYGGSFEGNGLPGSWTSDTDRYDLRISNGGSNGPAILNLNGVHFESSAGKANVWIEHNSHPGTYSFVATDFLRNGATHYVTNCILLDTTGASACSVDLSGCGYVGVSGYVASAARRVIAEGTVVGTAHQWALTGCIGFDGATDGYASTLKLADFSYNVRVGTQRIVGQLSSLTTGLLLDYTSSDIARIFAFKTGSNAGIDLNVCSSGSSVLALRLNANQTVQSVGSYQALFQTVIPAGGTNGVGIKYSSTSDFGIFFGSGAPTLSAAQGSLYTRSDGLPYFNTNGATTWQELVGVSATQTLTNKTLSAPILTNGASISNGSSNDVLILNQTTPASFNLDVQWQDNGSVRWVSSVRTSTTDDFLLAYNVARASNDILIAASDGAVSLASTATSTNTTSGALKLAGGLGVVGAGYFGSNILTAGYLRVGSTTAPTNTTAGDLTIVRMNVGNVTQVQAVTISGDASATGYLRVGSNTAPNNTTAGDITGVRLSLGNGAFSGARLVYVNANATGNTSFNIFDAQITGQSDVTNNIRGYYTLIGTQATSYTLSNLYHFSANANTFGAGSTVTNQFGFIATSSLTGASNFNCGFYSDIASSSGRWNFYASGTANNAFNGNSRFGGVTAPTVAVDVTGAVLATTTITATGGLVTGLNSSLVTSNVAMNNGAGAGTGTLTNAPASTNPTKWIPVNDNGTTRYIPAW